jgi:dynein heavy chain
MRVVEEAISKLNLAGLFDALDEQMIDLTKLVRNRIGFQEFRTLSYLIVLNVHAHDVVENMLKSGVDPVWPFDWMAVMKYYWEKGTGLLMILTYEVKYGHEYLGNTSPLIIALLTDRWYLALTSTLQLNIGGPPHGQAGTGKTGTTKDLAKVVAFQYVV